MKIKLSDVVKPITFEFLGSEEWLAPIRGSFTGAKRPLQGHLEVFPKGQGRFEVKGRISFEPLVACSKCNDPIPWNIEEEVHVLVQKSDKSRHEENDEIELTAEDLELYEVKGDQLDLETILNDIVHLAIPYRCVLVDLQDNGEEKCRMCGDVS